MGKRKLDNDLIKKYCGQEMSFRIQGAMNNLQENAIKIVNTGMVSSGKSSLYNVLTGNTENERFPTGAARTTTIADPYTYKNMIFIDTPGIDVRDVDDEIAFSTIMESDIILMIHNIKTGPLTKAESDWMKRIASAMPNLDVCRQRMIFVCTWKDTREKEEGYSDIFKEACNMAFEAVGTEIPVFDVSVLKYQNGMKKNKAALCEKSGINELNAYIEEISTEYAKVKHQYAVENYKKAAEEVLAQLEQVKEEKNKKVSKKKDKVKQSFQAMRNTWSGVFKYFVERRNTLDELKKELNNI